MRQAWFYRKDWFSRPEIQEEFKKATGRDLTVPQTWAELLETAKFFQGKEIDGKKVYGAAIFTERASEGITMGATQALYPDGFKYENTTGKYDMDGAVNSEGAVKGLEAYKELYKCCTPPTFSSLARPGKKANQFIAIAAWPDLNASSVSPM